MRLYIGSMLLMLCFSFTSYGQHEIGVKIAGGVSNIINDMHLDQGTQTTTFLASGLGGFYYRGRVDEHYSINAELVFDRIGSKDEVLTPATNAEGGQTGQFISDELWKHISYIGIPVYASFDLDKISLNLGAQILFTTASSGRDKGQFPTGPNPDISWDRTVTNLNIKSYEIGPRIGCAYALTNDFAIEVTYFYGVTNILNIDSSDWKWNIQQATIGLRYKIVEIGG